MKSYFMLVMYCAAHFVSHSAQDLKEIRDRSPHIYCRIFVGIEFDTSKRNGQSLVWYVCIGIAISKHAIAMNEIQYATPIVLR
jgi:hypothetical protein